MSLTLGLHQVLQQQPERVATWFGDRQRSYREVTDRVARIATVLREYGVGTGWRCWLLTVTGTSSSTWSVLSAPMTAYGR